MGWVPDYKKMMVEVGEQIVAEMMPKIMQQTEKMVASMVDNVLMAQIRHYENIDEDLKKIKERLGV